MIKAITFDFWDTLACDDSDEPKRAALGLLPKPQARLQLLTEEVRRCCDIPAARVQAALEQANARVRRQWQRERHTPSVPDRLQLVFDILQLQRSPGFDALVHAIETMEVDVPPDFVPGVAATLPVLARDFKLGIVSDTIHTPGRGLRVLLERAELLRYFSHWVFSDEVGASKPAPVVFELAAAGLGAPLTEMVHVGDRERNDVTGPQALGMSALLFTGAVDRGSAETQADAVCKSFVEIPDVIRSLEQS